MFLTDLSGAIYLVPFIWFDFFGSPPRWRAANHFQGAEHDYSSW
jgi:hypothetical protein